jgi:hypothetical protein
MKWISLSDMIDYLDTTSIKYPITMEIDGLDDSRGDNPCQRFKFTSLDDMNEWCADLAGFIGSRGMNELQTRII